MSPREQKRGREGVVLATVVEGFIDRHPSRLQIEASYVIYIYHHCCVVRVTEG